jgi:hypothetical protein
VGSEINRGKAEASVWPPFKSWRYSPPVRFHDQKPHDQAAKIINSVRDAAGWRTSTEQTRHTAGSACSAQSANRDDVTQNAAQDGTQSSR